MRAPALSYVPPIQHVLFLCVWKKCIESARSQNRFFFQTSAMANSVSFQPQKALCAKEREREWEPSGWWVEKPPFVVLKKFTSLVFPLFVDHSLDGDAALLVMGNQWARRSRAGYGCGCVYVCVRFLIFYIVFQWAALSFLSLGFLIDAVLDNLWHHAEFFGAVCARELMKCAARRPERLIILCVGE